MDLDKSFPKEKILPIVNKIEGTENVELIKVANKPGTAAGDNYSGLIIASDVTVKVNNETKTYNWMVKVPVQDPARRIMVRGIHAEEKEVDMYSRVIPEFQKLIKERKANIELNFCPVPFAEYHKDVENIPGHPSRKNVSDFIWKDLNLSKGPGFLKQKINVFVEENKIIDVVVYKNPCAGVKKCSFEGCTYTVARKYNANFCRRHTDAGLK